MFCTQKQNVRLTFPSHKILLIFPHNFSESVIYVIQAQNYSMFKLVQLVSQE